MTHWRQPWQRLKLDGRPARLQVLDPEAAFELEPEIIARLGNPMLLAIANPAAVAEALEGRGRLRRVAEYLGEALARLDLDGPWLARAFERSVLDRLEVSGALVGTWEDWTSTGLSWRWRWTVLGAQLEQTFGPMWRRKPYPLGGRAVEDYGVPGTNASIAVGYASAISKLGLASSAAEVLREWTPEQVADIAEEAARDAEIDRRAAKAAESKRASP